MEVENEREETEEPDKILIIDPNSEVCDFYYFILSNHQESNMFFLQKNPQIYLCYKHFFISTKGLLFNVFLGTRFQPFKINQIGKSRTTDANTQIMLYMESYKENRKS